MTHHDPYFITADPRDEIVYAIYEAAVAELAIFSGPGVPMLHMTVVRLAMEAYDRVVPYKGHVKGALAASDALVDAVGDMIDRVERDNG